MAGDKISVYVGMLEKAHRDTMAAAGQVAPERRLFQLGEGRPTPLWLMGHLATVYNNVIVCWMFEGKSAMAPDLSLKFAPGMAGGTPPTTNRDDYPAWEELVALYDQAMVRVVEGVSALDDAVLDQPLRGELPERVRGYFTSHAVTLDMMVSHDAYHRGQLALLGKSA